MWLPIRVDGGWLVESDSRSRVFGSLAAAAAGYDTQYAPGVEPATIRDGGHD
jgi:hypothetical protein